MKTTKKAFTLMELLVSMIVCMMLLIVLFSLLAQTYKVYDRTTARDGQNGYTIVMLSDIETLVNGCDYITIDDTGKIISVHDNGTSYAIDTKDYGVDASVYLDEQNRLIKINIGGEEYCVIYVLNTPS